MPEETYDEGLFPSKEAFKDAQDAWGEGTKENDKSAPIGVFNAVVTEAELGRASSSDKLQIKYVLEILAGESKGVKLFKFDGLSTAQQVAIAQSQLNRLGIKTSGLAIDKLPAILLSLVDKNISIKCQQNGDFHNTYFQKMLGDTVGGADKGGKSEKKKF